MRRNFIFLLLLFFVSDLQGQNRDTVDSWATLVIANGGLKLREQPNKQGKIFQIIPFGEQIKYLSNNSQGKDSVVIKNESGDDQTVFGDWVKVSYKNQKGYVLNIFLTDDYTRPKRFQDAPDDNVVLLYPGCTCNNENIHNPTGRKWYGYFEHENNVLTVEEIELNYYNTYKDNTYFCPLTISASKTKKLKFIIGSKKDVLDKKYVLSYKKYAIDHQNKSKSYQKALSHLSLEIQENKTKSGVRPEKLYLKRGDKKQLLNREAFDYPAEVNFVGDIDGDLKDDYIISYGDMSRIIVLYLTKSAKPGELIKMVSFFYASYCC